MIVGIDNGLSGAAVALSPVAGAAPVAMLPMPCMKSPAGGNEVDVIALVSWISKLEPGEDGLTLAIEDCPHHSKDKASMRSMAFTAGKIIGALEARFARIPIIRVKSGNALDGWQRQMLGNVPKGMTKAYALVAANGIWPGERWLATPRCKTPDTGLVDAALIAEFIRRGGHLISQPNKLRK